MRIQLLSIGILVCIASVRGGLEEEFDDIDFDAPSSPGVQFGDNEEESVPTLRTSVFVPPKTKLSDATYLAETFQVDGVKDLRRWVTLENSQYSGNWSVEDVYEPIVGDKGIIASKGMSYYGLAADLKHTWDPKSAPDELYGSLEASFNPQHVCGGGYFKLFNTKGSDVSHFDGTTPYSIMFGPDYCGYASSKVHFIIQRDSGTEVLPRTEFAVSPTVSMPDNWKGSPHQYGFSLKKSTNEFAIYIDGEIVKSGKLVDHFSPAFKSDEMIPDPEDVAPEDWTPLPMEIPDPTAVKPADWDESEPEEIPDPDAPMPEGWLVNEPLTVPNMEASEPDDWDDEEDGKWIRPTMKNPKCDIGCGPWTPTKRNPKYVGQWQPPMIPNPDYTPTYPQRKIPHPAPFDYSQSPILSAIEPFNAIGFELWTVNEGIAIDNVFVSTSKSDYETWYAETYGMKKDLIAENNARPTRSASSDKTLTDSGSTTAPYVRYASFGAIGCVLLLVVNRVRRGFCCKKSAAAAEATEEKKSSEEPKESSDKDTEPTEGTGETKTRKRNVGKTNE